MHIISYIVLLSSIALIKPINYQKPTAQCIQLITTIAKELSINEYLSGRWCWDYEDSSGDESGSGDEPDNENGSEYNKCDFDCSTCENIATEIYSLLIGTIDTDYDYNNVFSKCIEVTGSAPLNSEQVNSKSKLRIAVYAIIGGLLSSALVGIGLVCRPMKKT